MMTRQIGGQLSSRYESKTLGVEKLMKENARLQKELTKEANAHDKLKASKASLLVIQRFLIHTSLTSNLCYNNSTRKKRSEGVSPYLPMQNNHQPITYY